MTEYSRGILKVVVAQICQIIGWHSINSTPLEFIVDLMQEYLLRVSRLAHQYAEILGRTDVNLDDLGLAFQQMNIDVHQLAEYVKNVDSVPCVISVPKLSIFHDNHLNFLKPGSKEVVTRSVHVHEHLPAMNLEILADEVDESLNNQNIDNSHNIIESTENEVSSIACDSSSEIVFKRPCEPLPEHLGISKKTRVMDENRPLREIHSVMMTTSGFLSPAREGKLPESRTPTQVRVDSPVPSSYPMVPPELKFEKKMKKIVRKVEDRKLDKENKKKSREKELFKPDKINEPKMKKPAGMKETLKLKSSKAALGKISDIIPPSSTICHLPTYLQKEDLSGKINKKISPKVKNDKIVNTISTIHSDKRENNFSGKLSVEPDKQKLNIFKKISKSRDDRSSDFPEHHKMKEIESHTSSSTLLCDEAELKLVHNETDSTSNGMKTSNLPEEDSFSNTELMESRSPSSDVYMFDDMSPPGTPSTPKTPELSVPGCAADHKKRRKDKSNRKRDNVKSLQLRNGAMKNKSSSDPPDTDLMSRPKTPDAPESTIQKDISVTSAISFPFFPAFPTAPGLIPHPIHHQIFSRFPISLPRGPPSQHPLLQNAPLPPRFLSSNSNINEVPLLEDKLYVDTGKMSYMETSQINSEKSEKINKIGKVNHVSSPPMAEISNSRYEVLGSSIPSSIHQVPHKVMKPEKNDKKSKKHKIEKKERIKKKKDKKEKHKEKLEKNKEKKEKLEKLLKVRDRKERKDKRKDKDKEEMESESVPKITLKLGAAPPSPPTTESNTMKKITIKPLVKKMEESAKRESSPELAKISALVTRPPKQKLPRMKQDAASKKNDMKDDKAFGDKKTSETTSTIMDQGGHQVWICPACGNQDDGSPMIGCDDCDAWYHWVCVGMQVPPATNEDWYCRLCIAKKQELHHDKKKKKRKKKVKVVN